MPAATSTNIVPLALQASLFTKVPMIAYPIPSFSQMSSVTKLGLWMTCANTIYAARRSNIRQMKKRELLKIRLTREDGVSLRAHTVMILAWQAFVFIFPFVEIFVRMFGLVSFIYYYPNANGLGIILEPLSVQHLKYSKRAKSQIRFDWHEFSVNTGNIGRDGYRHPPSVTLNVPHIDVPKRGIKHWPWRRPLKRKSKLKK